MPEIGSIEKITLTLKYHKGLAPRVVNFWTPRPLADEILIRDVKWIGDSEDNKYFSLWSSITNDFAKTGDLNPLPRFHQSIPSFPDPPNHLIEFRVFEDEIKYNARPLVYNPYCEIGIHLELISYKKNYVLQNEGLCERVGRAISEAFFSPFERFEVRCMDDLY